MIKIDTGNTKGITRKTDKLGRIVLPIEFRNELNIKPTDALEIFLVEDGFYIAKK